MAFDELKERQAQIWGSAPFERVAEDIAVLHDHLVAELGPRPGAIHSKVASTTRDWTDLFVQLLSTAQASGAINADEDVEQLAFELDSYLVLANFGFVMDKTLEPLERGRRAYMERLERAKTKP